MDVSHVEVLVEEPSMEVALRALLPRLLASVSFKVYPHQCKHDLLQRLPDRLRAYSKWLPADWRIVVLVDRDGEDCRALKQRLEDVASDAGLLSRATQSSGAYQVVNRLAIEELEAWYFGDWDAVLAAYPRVAASVPRRQKYRDPDGIAGGTWEAFERILQRAGYFGTGLRKIEAARAIAPNWTPAASRSRSFQVFRDALQEMTS